MSQELEAILEQLRELSAPPAPDEPQVDEDGNEIEVEANETETSVSVDAIRDLASSLETDQALADELWAADFLQARLLATCVADPSEQSLKTIQAWVKATKDEDLATSIADLVAQTEIRNDVIAKFVTSKDAMAKTVGFASIASTVNEDPDQRSEVMEEWLQMITAGAEDDREEVRTAVSNALLEIGKVDQYWHDAAIVLACELQAEGPNAIAIGTEAEDILNRMGAIVDRRSGNSKNARNQNGQGQNRRRNKNNKNSNNNRRGGRGQQGQNNSGGADGKKPGRRNGRNKRRGRAPAPKAV